jgi:hypothetical protein
MKPVIAKQSVVLVFGQDVTRRTTRFAFVGQAAVEEQLASQAISR